jgi:hypothetical protein
MHEQLPLLAQQKHFARMVAILIEHINAEGYACTLGDAYRDPRVFGQVGEKRGYGKAKSMHKLRLAIDINLFRGDVLLRDTSDHKPIGEYWEKIGGSWGGRWGDGNHYSFGE